ncbi:hypothetical protein KVT40_007171 [Elsinoe batatas]|uniref:Membrane anchor Opy2 N-terminal domain-containing protein n=1 Tax=Elsinoe batatas TaxID=2601811 RepID=A0A8K0L0W4_9PEZI|nr:hypothetical protein KVT40_007171 [Elsinoe batatas]
MASMSNGNHLFKRDCLACPPETPSCPVCPGGQVCSLVQQSCDECAHMVCVATGVTTGTPSSGPNVGAIAGGVVGGVVFVAVATFLVWWFWIRPRREMDEYEEEWEEEEHQEDAKSQFREERDARASVHTVHSVASTVLSRASNMIPIAFIPGVTNRDGTMTTAGTPPVPPIPAARSFSPSPLSSQHSGGDAIFFSPGDLRNSAYSSTSTLDNRKTFIGRPSISPSLARESVASDIYQDDAGTNPMPAQQVVMTRPNMVSVKSGSSVPTTQPASPDSDFASAHTSQSPRVMMPVSGTPSVRSNASFVKPNAVTILKKGANSRFAVRQQSNASSKPSIRSPLGLDTDTEDDDEDPHARARQSLLRNNGESNVSSPATSTMQSPFSDDSELTRSASSRYTGTTNLSAVIEEATRRASRLPDHKGLGGRDTSPFGDEHATKE